MADFKKMKPHGKIKNIVIQRSQYGDFTTIYDFVDAWVTYEEEEWTEDHG